MSTQRQGSSLISSWRRAWQRFFSRRPLPGPASRSPKLFFESLERRESPTGLSPQSVLGLTLANIALVQAGSATTTALQRPTFAVLDQDGLHTATLAGSVGIGNVASGGGSGGVASVSAPDHESAPVKTGVDTGVFSPLVVDPFAGQFAGGGSSSSGGGAGTAGTGSSGANGGGGGGGHSGLGGGSGFGGGSAPGLTPAGHGSGMSASGNTGGSSTVFGVANTIAGTTSTGGVSSSATAAPSTTSLVQATPQSTTPSGSLSVIPLIGGGGGSGPPHLHATTDPVNIIDVNKQILLTPGVPQNDFMGWNVSLLAQVQGSTVSTYSWDLSNAPNATSVSGSSTANLQLTWGSASGPGQSEKNTIKLTVTDTLSVQHTETVTFTVWKTTSPAWASAPPTMPSTWPTVVPPEAMTAQQTMIAGNHYSLGADTGEVTTDHAMPGYNPGVAPLDLTYSSLAAEPKPIFLVYYQLDPSVAVPATVSAQLTLNGTAGTTYYYDTSASNGNPMLNPSDVLQIALQGDATGLSTGRYSYSVAVTANYSTPVTTTLSGDVDIINESSSPYGAGWTLGDVERISSVTGGVILELPGGQSLWFASAGGGSYTTPAGDFSTMTSSGGTYTRTLKDGTKINFNSSGLQTSIVDRNNNTTTFSYSSTTLTAITDMNGLTTSFGYTSGKLTSITDPASRTTTFAQDTGSRLTQITDPDSAVWGYTYDSTSKRLKTVTDPRTHTATFSYNAAGRVTGVTRADSTSDSLTPVQVNGLVLSGGTSGNPAAPSLLVNSQAQYTDPLSHVWQTWTDWSGFGKANETQDQLADTDVNYQDAQGLQWVQADALSQRTRNFFDSEGNVTEVVHADDSYAQYAYNTFSEQTQVTDETGFVTTNSYDAHGNLTQVTQPAPDTSGLTTSPIWDYTYTTKGSVSTQTDPDGHTTTYAYDSRNRLTAETDPTNHTVHYAYDSASNVTSVTDALSHTTTKAYDAENRLTAQTDALGHTTTYGYDADGNETSITDPLSHTTTQAFDNLNRITKQTDPLSHTTSYGYDSAGNKTSQTDPLNHTTTWAYDSANRVTAMTGANGHTTTYALDLDGQTLSMTDALSHTFVYSYTARGYVSTITNAADAVTGYSYNAVGELVETTSYGGLVMTGDFPTIVRVYDRLHRLVTLTDQDSHTTTYGYDQAGNQTIITDGLSHTTTNAYDADNRLTASTDALGHTTTYGYDAAGNKTSQTDPLGHTTSYAYDADYRLTAQTDALSHTTSFGYDSAGRETSITDPDSNTTAYAFDAANRQTAVTDPNGHTTTYGYDAANRMTTQTDRDGRQRNFSYDNVGNETGETWISSGTAIYTATYAYDAANNLTSESDNYSTYTFAYDAANRLTSVDNYGTPGAPHVVLSYGYDGFSNRISLSDNSANEIDYYYDYTNKLTAIDAGFAEVALAYDAANNLTSASIDDYSDPSMSASYGYDAANRLTNLAYTYNTTALATFTYAYDSADRVTGYTGPDGSLSYTYDNTNQLTGVSGAHAETYTYDANGNRTMTGYSTTTGNRLTSDGTYSYTYDNEGNLTTQTKISDSSKTVYSYDYRNRLTEVAVMNSSGVTVTHDVFTYDVEDRRIAKAVNGTTTWTAYDGKNPYADYNNSGTLIEEYLHGLAVDQLFARSDGTNTAFYLTDKLGSVREIVSASGSALDTITYNSFGVILSETSPSSGDRFKFTGREWDSEIGEYYFRARYVAPTLGRFLGQDPLQFAAHDTNLYRYVSNNPTAFTDPTGNQKLNDLLKPYMPSLPTTINIDSLNLKVTVKPPNPIDWKKVTDGIFNGTPIDLDPADPGSIWNPLNGGVKLQPINPIWFPGIGRTTPVVDAGTGPNGTTLNISVPIPKPVNLPILGPSSGSLQLNISSGGIFFGGGIKFGPGMGKGVAVPGDP